MTEIDQNASGKEMLCEHIGMNKAWANCGWETMCVCLTQCKTINCQDTNCIGVSMDD